MKKSLAVLGACVPLLAPALATSATVEELERRIEQLERQSSNNRSVSDVDLKVSGFINAGAAATSNLTDNVISPLGELSAPTYDGLDNAITYDNLTSAGIQLQAEVNEQVSGTIQLYAQGEENFDAQVEWAYIT